jgi:hypothetical protein
VVEDVRYNHAIGVLIKSKAKEIKDLHRERETLAQEIARGDKRYNEIESRKDWLQLQTRIEKEKKSASTIESDIEVKQKYLDNLNHEIETINQSASKATIDQEIKQSRSKSAANEKTGAEFLPILLKSLNILLGSQNTAFI